MTQKWWHALYDISCANNEVVGSHFEIWCAADEPPYSSIYVLVTVW